MTPTAQEMIKLMPAHLNKQAAGDLKAVFQFTLSGANPCSCYLDVADGICTYQEGEAANPSITILCKSEVFEGILTQTKDPFQAFMLGELQVRGNIPLALKLQSLFSA